MKEKNFKINKSGAGDSFSSITGMHNGVRGTMAPHLSAIPVSVMDLLVLRIADLRSQAWTDLLNHFKIEVLCNKEEALSSI